MPSWSTTRLVNPSPFSAGHPAAPYGAPFGKEATTDRLGRLGPERVIDDCEPEAGPIVQFYDANDQRFRYIPADKPPIEADNAIDWDNSSGHWHVRPLVLDDQKWVMLPGLRFPHLPAFKAWAVSYSYATVGEPILDFGG